MKKYAVFIFVVLLLLTLLGCRETITSNECSHSFGMWSVTKEASCANNGVQSRVCEKCGYTDTQPLSSYGHTEVIDTAVQATCTTDGKTEGKHCSVCNAIIVAQTTIPSTHNYDNGKISTPTSCKAEGIKEYTCNSCGNIKTEAIPKTNHDYNSGAVTTSATCESAGVKTYTCNVCGSTKTETIEKLDHAPNSNYICTRCGKKCPVELKMSSSEIAEAKKVNWISNREIDDLEDEKQFRLMFSLKDSSEKYLKVPVIVEIKIENDNGEVVYNATKIVKASDYGGWTNAYGKEWTAAAIYIKYSEIASGTTEGGKVTFTVYNDYVSFDPTTLTIYDNLPLKPTTIILPTLPDTIHRYNWDDRIDSSCKITNITYEISGDDLYLYFTGEKTYDAEGNKYSQSCVVGWKLYDADGYVVDSGTFYSPNMAVGEKFKNEKEYAWDVIIPGETYILKISNVD